MSRISAALLIAGCLGLAACGTRASSDIAAPAGAAAPAAPAKAHKDPGQIPVLTTDVTDRKYHSLGDITVTVSKNTVFDSDPTPAQVDDELRKRAAELGADAVILARYGTVGIGFWSWGKLEGSGRAIAYDQ
ncbi:MAG TPA: hypothetical protein VHA35_13455 [Dongiaceae bacterium]|nr:hypothetical protein [Dongiaceae bacterium]